MSASKSEGRKAETATVGYKRPPVTGQFKKGHSGNPRGRPRGRPNVATLHKALFNEPIKLREGGKSRTVPAGEAIFLLQAAQAGQGDQRSLFTVMEILDMTGRTKEISDEEREKRALHLPASYSLEEMDLVNNPACQKERERCRMMVESDLDRFARPEDGAVTMLVPPDIQAGDQFAADRQFDQALTAYQREIADCKVELSADGTDKAVHERFRRAVGRIGLLADTLLLAGEFEQAIAIADLALEHAVPPFWVNETHPQYEHFVTTSTTWIQAIRAHAGMLIGRVEPARGFYNSLKGNPKLAMASWETAVLRDFVRLRKAGLAHPLMDEIEKRYTAAGWTTAILNTRARAPQMKPDEVGHLVSHSDDIRMGDRLRDNGHLHEAVTVYIRNLRKWRKNLDKDGSRPDWQQNLNIAADRVAQAIRQLFRDGKFITPLEYATEAAARAPDHLLIQAVKACALLLAGEHDNEARSLFMRHLGKSIEGKIWEQFIADQFAELRKIGCARPLMDEIEQRFAGIEVSEFPESDAPPTRQSEDPTATLANRSDIPSAERLVEQGFLEQALVVYGRCLQECTAKIELFKKGVFNTRALDDRVTVSDKLIQLTAAFVAARNFVKAQEAIELALSANHSPLLEIWHAHVLMFLERVDEARNIYLANRTVKVNDQFTGADAILSDFAAMRRQDLNHPLMSEIETLLAARSISR